MEHAEYEMMYRAEDHHWWYHGMRAITRAVIERFVVRGRSAPLRILDAGCGTGSTLEYLQDYGWTVGIDLAPEAVGFCTERGLPRLAQASIVELPFAAGSFDLITSFDVMSAVPRSMAPQVLAEFFRVLRPGGHVLLRLPAYMWLYGRHDQLVHTQHRFTRGEVRALLREQGFAIERTSYANCLLFPLAAAKRLKDRLLPPAQQCSDVSVTGGWMDPMCRAVLRSEAPLVSRIGLPFGLTVLALAKKPGRDVDRKP